MAYYRVAGSDIFDLSISQDLIAANVKKGVAIQIGDATSPTRFKDITGTFEGYLPSNKEVYRFGNWGSGWERNQVVTKLYSNNGTSATVIDYGETEMDLKSDNSASAIFYGPQVAINRQIDLSQYSALKVEFINPLYLSAGYLQIGAIAAIPQTYMGDVAWIKASTGAVASGIVTLTVDLSSITAQTLGYIAIRGQNSGWDNGSSPDRHIYVRRIYFE